MSEENEVPSDEDLKMVRDCLRTSNFKDDDYDEADRESAILKVSALLSALRASWEKEKGELQAQIEKGFSCPRCEFYQKESECLKRVFEAEKQALEAEKKGLEEREHIAGCYEVYGDCTCKDLHDRVVEEMKQESLRHLKYLSDANIENANLKAENESLKEGSNSIMCVYCGFKAKKDANVMADHIVFECEKRPESIVNLEKVLKDCEGFEKTIQELELANQLAETKIDTLTCALAEAHGALKPIADLNTSLEQDYVMGMAGVPDCDIISAREAIANKDGQRASEEMKGLRKVVEALKQIADFHVEEDHDLPEEEMRDIAKEALEAYESRGKV